MSMISASVLALTLVAVTVTDLRERVIPNWLLLVAAAFWLVISVWSGGVTVAEHLIAAVLVSLPLLGAAVVRPDGMGMGDVKLVALLGLYLGWQAWPALLLGLALGGLAGVLLSLGTRRPPSETSLPLAPFISAGAVPVMLVSLGLLQ